MDDLRTMSFTIRNCSFDESGSIQDEETGSGLILLPWLGRCVKIAECHVDIAQPAAAMFTTSSTARLDVLRSSRRPKTRRLLKKCLRKLASK